VEIIDTVYLVAYLNPADRLHNEAARIIESIGETGRVSQAALLELDLLMKSRGFTLSERRDAWTLLSALVGNYVEPVLPSDFSLAAILAETHGLDYFDSLVAAQCINRGAEPLTTDEQITRVVREHRGD